MRLRSGFILLVSCVLSACTTSPTSSVFPDITFAHLPAMNLNVAEVEIVDRYQLPADPPNVEHLFPISLSTTALEWGRHRLHPVGQNGRVRVTLHRASVSEVPLPKTGGVKGVFTIDQSERYDGVLEMSVEIINADDQVVVTVASTAKHSRSISEIASPSDRQKLWFGMTDTLVSDMNRSLESQIRTHMSDWLAN